MKEEIYKKVIYPAVDELRDSHPHPDLFLCAPETVLFGGTSGFDSLGLVSFIFVVEEKIQDNFNKEIRLTNEKAMSRKNSPFQSLKTLADYIEEELSA